MSNELKASDNPSLEYLESRRGGKCEVCFKPADRHHLDEVGMGRDRTIPMKNHFMIGDLCRKHHIELGQIGEKRFNAKYDVNVWEWACRRLAQWIWDKSNEEENE